MFAATGGTQAVPKVEVKQYAAAGSSKAAEQSARQLSHVRQRSCNSRQLQQQAVASASVARAAAGPVTASAAAVAMQGLHSKKLR
jgi:hypothetical protein